MRVRGIDQGQSIHCRDPDGNLLERLTTEAGK